MQPTTTATQPNTPNIIGLCGNPGAGKSRVGRVLGELYGYTAEEGSVVDTTQRLVFCNVQNLAQANLVRELGGQVWYINSVAGGHVPVPQLASVVSDATLDFHEDATELRRRVRWLIENKPLERLC